MAKKPKITTEYLEKRFNRVSMSLTLNYYKCLSGLILVQSPHHYILIYVSLNSLWLLDYELTTSQRIFVTENGYLAFVAGMVVGMVMFCKLRNWYTANWFTSE